jgi:hypothetical protein
MESSTIFTVTTLAIFGFILKYAWELLITVWAVLLIIAINGVGRNLLTIHNSIDDLRKEIRDKNM